MKILKTILIGVGGGCFLRWSELTFSLAVFGYDSNSHHNPVIVSLLLLAFVISKASLNFFHGP